MQGSSFVSGFLASKYLIECLDITIERTKEDRLTSTILKNSKDKDGYLDPYLSIDYIRTLISNDVNIYINKVNLTIKNYLNTKNERNKISDDIVDEYFANTTKINEAETTIEECNNIINELEKGDFTNLQYSEQVIKNTINRFRKKKGESYENLTLSKQTEIAVEYIISEKKKEKKNSESLLKDIEITREVELDDKYYEVQAMMEEFEEVTYSTITYNINKIVESYVNIFSDIFTTFLFRENGVNLTVIDKSNLKKYVINEGVPEIEFKPTFKKAFVILENNLDYLLSKDQTIYTYLGRNKTSFIEDDERLFYYLIDVDYTLESWYTPVSFDESENGVILKKISNTINKAVASLNDVLEELNEGIEKFNTKIKTNAINLVALYYEAIFRSRLLSMDKITKSLMKLPNTNFLAAFKKQIQDFINDGLDRILEFIKSIKSVIGALDMLIQIMMISTIKDIELPVDVFNNIKFCPNMFDPADSVVKAAYASVKIGIEYIKCIYEFEAKDELEDFCEEVNYDLKTLAANILGLFNLNEFDVDDWKETAERDRTLAYEELDDIISNLTEDQLFSTIKDVVDIIFDIILAVLLLMIVTLIISVIIKIIYEIIPLLGKFAGYLLSVAIIYVAYNLFYNCNEYYTIEWNTFYNTYNKYIEKNTSIDDYSEDEYGNKVPYIETVNNLVNGEYKSISSYTNKFKNVITKYGFEITEEETPTFGVDSLQVQTYKQVENQIKSIYNSNSFQAIGNKISGLVSSEASIFIIKQILDNDVEENWISDRFDESSTFGFNEESNFDYYKNSDSDSRKKYIKNILVDLSNDIDADTKYSEISSKVQGLFGITRMNDCVKDPTNLNPFSDDMVCEENLSDLNDELADDEIYFAEYCFEDEGYFLCVDVIKDSREAHTPEKFDGCWDYSWRTVLSEMSQVKNNNYLRFKLNVMDFFGIEKVIEIFNEWARAKKEVEDIITSIYEKLSCYLNKLNDFSCDDIIPETGIDREDFSIPDVPVLSVPNIKIDTPIIGCANTNQKDAYDALDKTASFILDAGFNSSEITSQVDEISSIMEQNAELNENNDAAIIDTKNKVEENSYQIEGKQYEKIKVYTKDLNEETEQMAVKLKGDSQDDEDSDKYQLYNSKLENGFEFLDVFGFSGKRYKDYFKDNNILSKYHKTWKDANGNNQYYGKNVNINKGLYNKQLGKIILELIFNFILRSPIELFSGNFPDVDTFKFIATFIKMPITWEKVCEYIRGYDKEEIYKEEKSTKLQLDKDLEDSIQQDINNLMKINIGNSNYNVTSMMDNGFCDEDGDNPCPNSDLTIQEKYKQGLITTCDMMNPTNQNDLIDAITEEFNIDLLKAAINSITASHPVSKRIMPYTDGDSLSDTNFEIILGDDDKYCI